MMYHATCSCDHCTRESEYRAKWGLVAVRGCQCDLCHCWFLHAPASKSAWAKLKYPHPAQMALWDVTEQHS